MTKQDIALNQIARETLAKLEAADQAATLESAKRMTLALLTLKWDNK